MECKTQSANNLCLCLSTFEYKYIERLWKMQHISVAHLCGMCILILILVYARAHMHTNQHAPERIRELPTFVVIII